MIKQNFLKPEQVLLESGLKPQMTVADLGCGNGFFSLPAAAIVGDQGQAYAVDIQEEVLGKIMAQARLQRQKNVRTVRFDLEGSSASEIPELSCDFAVIGKVLQQLKNPENLVREAYRVLKTDGVALVVEWKKEQAVFGPPYEQRLAEEDAKAVFIKRGFKFVRKFEPDKYHYVLLLQK